MTDERQAKAIFQQALEKPPAGRKEFLDRVCGDAALRRRVDVLLEAYDDLDDFLAEPTAGVAPETPTEGPGTVIGPYKLLQEIGEGGFGSVYMAEQSEPVRRKVALKVIKLGMDTKQVMARFEAERQALALMDHPHIAKVLDAGATDTGRPYFVMELVKGIPITEYCDQAELDTKARLDLFQKVCHAVQHAHQKGIIHRDLKPSNVLVTLHDGEPVPKVIDFGIAKAVDRPLTEKTLFTEFRQMIGTPDYMAPEQAELSGLDVDTRADIYSLGVLLYELLTGTKPFDLKTLMQQGYDEILRTIRDVDPQRPSNRVSTMGEQLAAVAKSRHIAAGLLGKLLRGDLDWIVMKALEKNRARRYETANALAMDVGRYLTDEPVRAMPPSAGYRARKYFRRHRAGVTAAVLVFVALIVSGGLAYAASQEAKTRIEAARVARADAKRKHAAATAARAKEQEQRTRAQAGAAEARTETKRAETVLEFIDQMLGSADPHEVKGRNYTVRQLLDDFDRDLGTRLKDQPEVEATVRTTMGEAYVGLGLYDKAESQLKAALDFHRRSGREDAPLADCLETWSTLLAERGRYDEAEARLREALAINRKVLGKEHPRVARELKGLAAMRSARGHYDSAEQLVREALRIQRKALSTEHPDVGDSLNTLAYVLHKKGDYEAAERLHREALAIRRKARGDEHPHVATSLNNLAIVLKTKGNYDAAEQLYREALAIRRKVLADTHPHVATSLDNLAVVLAATGNLDEAERLYREAFAIRRKALGDGHRDVATSRHNLALAREGKGDYEAAEKLLREAVVIARKALGDEHPRLAASLNSLAQLRHKRGDYDEAERLHREALAIWRKAHGDTHPKVATGLNNLAAVLVAKRDLDTAEEFYREAIAIKRRVLGDEHVSLAASLRGLAMLRHVTGDYGNAEKLNREALAIYRKVLGHEHPDLATSINDLAAVLKVKGDLDEAERLHREALAIWRKTFGDVHPHVATSLNNLAMVLEAKGDLDEAERLHRKALAIARKAFGDEHPHVATSLNNLLQVLLAKEDYPAAERICRELLVRGRSHSLLASLGMCLLEQDKHAEAEPFVRECLAIRAKKMPGHWLHYNAMSLLGGALAGHGKHAAAEPLLLEGYEKMMPPEQVAYRKREALDRIVKLYEAWNKPEKAAAWRAKR